MVSKRFLWRIHQLNTGPCCSVRGDDTQDYPEDDPETDLRNDLAAGNLAFEGSGAPPEVSTANEDLCPPTLHRIALT
jgi:hypothetical protein